MGGVKPMFASAVASLVAVVSAHAANTDGAEFFRAKVEPIFREHCFKCHSHSAEKIKGGLVLDSREAVLTGGDSGAVITPGQPEKSLLITAISYTNDDLLMPPKGAKLSAEKIATLTEWVKQGAPWADEKTVQIKATASPQIISKRPRGAKISDEDRKWWAFQPVKKVEPPVISKSVNSESVRRAGTESLITDHWPQNPIDNFVLARLQAEKLAPSPRASRAALIRRVTFDLIGLPPTPAEVAAFVADQSPDAYEKLVDRLLASPRYGERWARHWLDLVRYAESDGYRVDDFRPTAWRFRDYVIRSLNADKPYDRFVQEQIAGDELWPEDPDARIATGYLTLWIYEYNNRDAVGQIATILNDVTDTTADVFLGQGIQCARCHDHKFDPILQKDYFRLQAFFAPIMPVAEAPVASGGERAAWAQEMAGWERKTADVRAKLEKLETPFHEKAYEDALAKFPRETQALIKKPVAERTPYEHQVAELAYRQVLYEWSDKRFPARVKEPAKTERNKLLEHLRAMEKEMPAPLALAPQVTDVGPVPPPTTIPKKEKLGVIEPGYLSVLDEAPAQIETGWTNSTGRRTTLAHWLTRSDNPLSTRVIVNRVWQYHFGRGLAPITSDFGRLGEGPSHPELLDWLTRSFIENGWSLKKLHRLIVTSATYQQAAESESVISKSVNQSATPRSATVSLNTDSLITDSLITDYFLRARTIDPENKLLWHFPTRRLDAEQVRDAVLAVTGELELKDGGPSVDFSTPRRSVYNKVIRNTRDPVIESFDGPENFTSTSQRNVTTTPNQSLLMINGKWTLARAKALAARLRKEHANQDEQIDTAYQLLFGRKPGAGERIAAAAFLSNQAKVIQNSPPRLEVIPFANDKMPFREGRAAMLAPASTQSRLTTKLTKSAGGEFTIEAFIQLKSIYTDGQVRTVASKWSGKRGDHGWALGVTGAQSRNKPQTLVLQLCGDQKYAATDPVEPIFSGLHIDLGKPYFVAVSVKLADPTGITFFLKDLSNDDEPMQVVNVAHKVTSGLANKSSLVIGGRAGDTQYVFDGLIDDVRFSDTALAQEQLLFTSAGVNEHTMGMWRFEAEGPLKDYSGRGADIEAHAKAVAKEDPRDAALTDFCHVLLNANEFLYVD